MLQIEAAVRKLSQESIQYLGLLGKRNFYCVSRNVLRESKLVVQPQVRILSAPVFGNQLLAKDQTTNYVTRFYSADKKRRPDVRNTNDSDSDSDSDSDNENEHGNSDFWRLKMRTFHGILDLNNDGVISFDDYKMLAKRFENLAHLTPAAREEFLNVIKDLWEEQWGEITPYNLVSVEQYLTTMYHAVNDHGQRKKLHKFLPYLFKAVDKDHSGSISVKEFKLFYKCLGLSSEDAAVAFTSIDTNNDGRLSMKEFVKIGREFFVTEDENHHSKLFWGPLRQ